MHYKIALLLKPPVLKYCKENINFSSSKISLDYYSYSTMEDFEKISAEICTTHDGIITSGLLPDLVLSHQDYAQNISHSYFDFDIENTYRLILSELLLQPGLTISDIGIDLLSDTDMTLDDVILNNKFFSISENFRSKHNTLASYEIMENEEKQLAEFYIPLFENQKIKFVLTNSLTVAEILTSKEYPCKYIFPSSNTLEKVINNLCYKLDMRDMKGRLPAIIRIDLHPSSEASDSYAMVQYNIELKRKLTDFIQLEGANLSLRCNTNSFEIYSNQETICKLTNNYSVCCLPKYIDGPLADIVSVGYGLGFTFHDAHTHAITASDYSYNSNADLQKHFLINENEQLITLSNTSEVSEQKNFDISNDYLKTLSLEVKLSINTIIKIINVLEAEKTNEISSVELINHLGVSLRTANHYLSNLEKYGKATIVGQKRPNGKGRSINIYHLDLVYNVS